MSTPRADTTATRSRRRRIVVTRQSCGCSWNRTRMSTPREDYLATHSWQRQLTVMMGSGGFSEKKADANVQAGEHSSALQAPPSFDVPSAYPCSRRAQRPRFKDDGM